MTFKELRDEVRQRLRETSTVPTMWLDEDIDEAINEGYAEISDATEWYETFKTIDILLDRPYYDMRSVFGESFLAVGPSYSHTMRRWLIPTAASDLDRYLLRWEQRIAEPERRIVRGIYWVSYWPYKGVASGKVKQYVTALPVPLEDDDDEPGFTDLYHYGLVEYALADLFAQDAEVDLALQAWGEYARYEKDLSSYVDRRLSIPKVGGHGEER